MVIVATGVFCGLLGFLLGKKGPSREALSRLKGYTDALHESRAEILALRKDAHVANLKMFEAFHHAAKLSGIIYRQRLVIKSLKSRLPKKAVLSVRPAAKAE